MKAKNIFKYEDTVRESWIDHNNHLHDAQYFSIFSDTVVSFFDSLDFSKDYRKNNDTTIFNLEAHIAYTKELLVNESFYINVYIYNYDTKKVHLFLKMFNSNNEVTSIYEVVMIAVNNKQRRSTQFPEFVYNNIQQYKKDQGDLEIPKQIGRGISID